MTAWPPLGSFSATAEPCSACFHGASPRRLLFQRRLLSATVPRPWLRVASSAVATIFFGAVRRTRAPSILGCPRFRGWIGNPAFGQRVRTFQLQAAAAQSLHPEEEKFSHERAEGCLRFYGSGKHDIGVVNRHGSARLGVFVSRSSAPHGRGTTCALVVLYPCFRFYGPAEVE